MPLGLSSTGGFLGAAGSGGMASLLPNSSPGSLPPAAYIFMVAILAGADPSRTAPAPLPHHPCTAPAPLPHRFRTTPAPLPHRPRTAPALFPQSHCFRPDFVPLPCLLAGAPHSRTAPAPPPHHSRTVPCQYFTTFACHPLRRAPHRSCTVPAPFPHRSRTIPAPPPHHYSILDSNHTRLPSLQARPTPAPLPHRPRIVSHTRVRTTKP